jgi:hypothetical protein
MHDIYLAHLHAIGVPEGVTLLEFEDPSEEQQQPTPEVQEVQPSGEVPDEVAIECPKHRPCNFVKGKPRSILSLLILEMQLKYYCYIYIVALSLGVGCKHLLHWLSNPCLDIDTLNPI